MSFAPVAQLRDFTGGVNTKQRPNKIADNQLKSIISMDFVANSLQRAKGYESFGIEPDNTLTGKTLYKHSILAGQDVLVKTIGTYLKFYDEVDDKYYKLTDATFTTGKRWSFATFNGYLYGVNGVDTWVFWRGSARSTLNGAITNVDTIINLQTGHGGRFPTSGDVMIQDEKISYTGKAGDQLTGCTITQNHPSGSTVILKLDSTSTTVTSLTKAKRIEFFRNRMFAIDNDNPNILRHSKLADNTNPETDLLNFTIGSGAGDAGFGIAPDEIVTMKTFITGNNTSILAVFCKDGIVYSFVVTDGTNTTTNAFVPLRTMNSYPVAAHMVEIVENDLAFVDNHGFIRTLSYGENNTPVRVNTICETIEPSLELMDFSDGCIKYDRRKLYTAGKTQNAVTNDITLYRDSSYSAFGTYGHWDVIDLTIYNDRLYGLSVVTGNVWLLNEGYSANGNQYYSESVAKDYDFGLPLQYKQLLRARLSGFITNNCEAYIDFYFDNEEKPITFLIDGDNTDIVGNAPNVAVGSVIFGSGVFGGGLPEGVNRRYFDAEVVLPIARAFLKMTFKVRIDDQDVDFEINDMELYAKQLSPNVWKKHKSLKQI